MFLIQNLKCESSNIMYVRHNISSDGDESLTLCAKLISHTQRIGTTNTETNATNHQTHILFHTFCSFFFFHCFRLSPRDALFCSALTSSCPPLFCLPIDAVRNPGRKLGQYSFTVHGEPSLELAPAYELAELLDQPILQPQPAELSSQIEPSSTTILPTVQTL